MVQCELCGRQFKNTQGLRGHKTFFHGIRANRGKLTTLLDRFGLADEIKGEVGSDDSRLIGSDKERRENTFNESDEKFERLTKDIENITETLADLKGNLYYLQSRIVSLASQSEVRRIVSEVDRLNKQVKKHDQWLNPRGLHEVVIGLSGGPIASIEKRLQRRQSFPK